MKITPGFWRQRDGGKAHVLDVNQSKANYQIIGWDSNNFAGTWNLDGSYLKVGQNSHDLVAPWEEPKLRPWTRDEFPHWCAIRRKQGDKNDPWKDSIQFATTIVPEGCYIARSSEPYSWLYLLECYEHSTDGGKTWRPCGVMEGGAK